MADWPFDALRDGVLIAQRSTSVIPSIQAHSRSFSLPIIPTGDDFVGLFRTSVGTHDLAQRLARHSLQPLSGIFALKHTPVSSPRSAR